LIAWVDDLEAERRDERLVARKEGEEGGRREKDSTGRRVQSTSRSSKVECMLMSTTRR
jgi:hypothetical protein